jgi:MFS family permease
MLQLPPVAAPGKKSAVPFLKVVAIISKQGTALALSAIGFGCLSSFITLLFTASHWGESSWAISIFAATYVLTRLFFASFPDKYGGYRIAMLSLIIEMTGQALLWLSASKGMALAGCALTGMGFSLIFPALGVEAVKKVKPEMRGSAMGAYTAFTDLALGITGPLAGLIASWQGYHAIYLFGTVCCIASLLLIVPTKKGQADSVGS